jgi:hypothetical protein
LEDWQTVPRCQAEAVSRPNQCSILYPLNWQEFGLALVLSRQEERKCTDLGGKYMIQGGRHSRTFR